MKIKILFVIIVISLLSNGCEQFNRFLIPLERRNELDPYRPLISGKSRVYGRLTECSEILSGIDVELEKIYFIDGVAYKITVGTTTTTTGGWYEFDNIDATRGDDYYCIYSLWKFTNFKIEENKIIRLDIDLGIMPPI